MKACLLWRCQLQKDAKAYNFKSFLKHVINERCLLTVDYKSIGAMDFSSVPKLEKLNGQSKPAKCNDDLMISLMKSVIISTSSWQTF